MSSTGVLPHWDVSEIFPSLDSPEFAAACQNLVKQLDNLEQIFDAAGIRRSATAVMNDGIVATFDKVISEYNAMLEKLGTLRAYINAFTSTDAANNLAQARASELQGQAVRAINLYTRFTAWIGSLELEPLLAASTLAQVHEFALRRASVAAQHQMPEAEETLATQLDVTGGSAWAKLHGNFTARIMVKVLLPEGTKELPMSAVRNLAGHRDAAVREAAYHAELAAWENAAVPLAAAMNSIKGQVHTLNAQRSWPDDLAPSLFGNNIDAETLDAMQTACIAAFPMFRRYLHLKAKALGKERLAWFDMMAPLPGGEGEWPFERACDFIVTQFGTYSNRLSDFAANAFAQHWIDAEPRRGKRDGAFCMPIRPGESRILSNFSSLTFSGTGTLAHELGHGYHNLCLRERTALQRSTPMALAETASIFCETLVTQAALRTAAPAEKRSILEDSLQGACQVVVDIHSRFLFEKRVFAARAKRELTVDELNEIMLAAQKETYGDGLDERYLHQYMWAMKPHYYSSDRSFYNYPYTFGLLFGLGLYAQYEKDPDAFRQGYDSLLASTGLADAATLTARFGFDIRKPEFWESSLNIIGKDIDKFAELV